ncbi:hypothetical protein DFS33DRAFT_1457080 [Desarmillaria ectypa]|nr:hypothetical protein DFS33DRAFT_1457080 [Desarmillaria ectypa]
MSPSSVLFFLSLSAWALINITVDDTSSMINYKGSWDGSGSHTSSLDYGGSHTLSSDSSASATFTFTGIAVYFLSPLWPYPVSVMITVDGGVETILNLTDPVASSTDSGGSESSQSDVRWCMTGLSHSLHKAVVSMPPSGNWVVVDGFIYTVDNGSETATSSTASASDPASASATATGSSSSGLGTNVLGIALGASLGAVTLLTAIGIFFCCRWRRNTSKSTLDKPTIDNSIPLDDISPTPYLVPPTSTTYHYTSSTNKSPAPEPGPMSATSPTSLQKSYTHPLKPTNPDENAPLNRSHDLVLQAAGSNEKSTPSLHSEHSHAGEKAPPPPYSRS